MRNLGLFILLFHILFFFVSGTIYYFEGNEELWFSRIGLSSILLGLYLIADK